MLPVVTDVNETLFWSRTSELVMLVSMMSQSAMIQSSYNLPTPTIINRLVNKSRATDVMYVEPPSAKETFWSMLTGTHQRDWEVGTIMS